MGSKYIHCNISSCLCWVLCICGLFVLGCAVLAWPGISDYGGDMMTGRKVIVTGLGPEPKVPCASRRFGPR